MGGAYQNMPLGFGKMGKGLKIFLISFLGLILLFVTIMVFVGVYERTKLRKEGLRVSAMIKNKFDETTGTRKSPKHTYYFDLDLFVESTDTSYLSTSIKEKKSFAEKIDALVADSKERMESINYKSYASVRITVSWESYDKYIIGDKVKVVHLKDDVESTKLLEDIE